ncbi:hypothetical protein Q2T46_07540 [Thermoanaerobacterium sp. CMT5567-10]|uniref:hypothetical protein n=1 Tax=Thermoanaerobacterium sp. CMT5567-10 TaxID=3061989 RepID=UPI0026DEEC04|nr:hypothetical protein [Thermoanaerobacterium sp. CMT5567-10]WKV10274.1 hypothetical protein Q2T46_07540 [Thermoanaerobacterium sp. CMT5567-10]
MSFTLGLILYVVSTLLVTMTSVKWTKWIKLSNTSDEILTSFLFSITEILLINIVLGILLKMLYPIYLFIFVAVLFIATCFYLKDWSFNIKLKSIINFFRDVKFGPLLIILSFMTIIGVIWVVYITLIYPPYGTDELMYHLVGPVEWMKHGMIFNIHQDYISQWINWYPKNTEILFLWNMIFFKNDVIVDGTQLIFALIGIIGIYGIGRKIGLNKYYSLCAGLLFFLTPIVFIQSKTAYIDVAFSVMVILSLNFLIHLYKEFSLKYVYLFSLTVAFMSGMKGSGPIYAVILLTLLFVVLIKHRYDVSFKDLAYGLSIYILFSITLGAFWYYRTWYFYENPIYPFTLSFHGITIFKGLGTAKQIIFDPNLLPQMKDMGYFKRIYFSWYENFNFLKGYSYDTRIGGFGAIWYIIVMPAILIFILKSIIDRKWVNIFFAISTVILFLASSENWWSRYVIFIVALGYVAISYIVQNVKFTRIVVPIIIALVTFSFVVSIKGYLPVNISSRETFYELRKTPILDRSTYMANPFYGNDMSFLKGVRNKNIAYFLHAYIYPLYGERLSNNLFYLGNVKNESSFKEYIDKNKIDYAIVAKGSIYNKYLRNDRKFTLVYNGKQHDVYRLIK